MAHLVSKRDAGVTANELDDGSIHALGVFIAGATHWRKSRGGADVVRPPGVALLRLL